LTLYQSILQLLLFFFLLNLIIIFFFCFFFFQAEDGIRDGHVTGVQTCALPIFRAECRTARPIVRPGPILARILEAEFVREIGLRSEERRVGKECRSRWSS